MKLPLLSWNKTIRNLGFRVIRRPQSFKVATKTKLRKKEAEQQSYGPLEPRQMLAGDTGLAIQADLNQLLDTFDDPIVVRTGQFDNNTSWDAAVLSSSGNLTIATNGDDGTWQNRRTVDLGVGPLNGLEVARVNNDIFADLILQGPDGIYVAAGDGEGNFAVNQTLSPLVAGALAASSGSNPALDIAVGLFDGDANQDLVALSPSTGQVVFYAGNGDGTFAGSVLESTGALAPISITTGDFVGGSFPDLAIGHEGGEVTFLENKGNGDIKLRPELTVSGFSAVKDLSSADVDDDGDTDIVVASGDDLTILQNSKSQTDLSPVIDNGTFGRGLSDWNVEVVGERTPDTAGRVIAQSGFAQLVENESFLVSINQSIVIPNSPEDLKVDLLSVGLEDPAGGIPDAFEISILDESGNSLVPTFQSNATSFFNINPGNVVSTAAGVTFDGTTVTLDISGIPAGTQATVYFDLIGNGPGSGSTVTIDDVRVTPENEFVTPFIAATLEGPFTNANQIAIADVDGDGRLDIAATDTGASQVLVFNGQGGLVFDREEIAVPGTGLVSLDTAPLTAGDSVDDLVVLAQDSDLLISPLVGDRMVPTVELLRPVANTTGTNTVDQIEFQFSEPMRVTTATSSDSTTFVGNYELRGLGADGIADTADDVVIGIESLTYDLDSGLLVLVPDSSAAPLADGTYVITLESSRLADTSENLLNDGVPVEFSFTVNAQTAQFASLNTVTAAEGSAVEITAGFNDQSGATPYTATIDWGDGTVSEIDTVEFSAGAGTIEGSHVYADNGQYSITVALTDANARTVQAQTTATIGNADPVFTTGPTIVDVVQGQTVDQLLATFEDAGFTSATAGTEETFSASIDWGDGTTSSNAAVEVIQGTVSVATVVGVSGDHSYEAAGEFTATVTLTDDDGGTATSEILFRVAGTAPTIEALAEISASEGDSVSLQTTFDDETASESYTATVDWGDGSTTTATVSFNAGTGTITADHVYADDGQYLVVVTLTDDAGATAQSQTVASIANVVPTLSSISNGTATAGDEFSISQIAPVTFADPGFSSFIAATMETFTASVDWGDGIVSEATLTVNAGGPGVFSTGTLEAQHTFSSAGTFDVTVTLADDDSGVVTQTFSVSVAPAAQTANAWLPSIDFDSDAAGNGLTRGQRITDQWAAWGVHITTDDPINNPAMIFDSAQPTGGDGDLGTPNQSFDGPGIGSGGNSNSQFANSIAQSNVLIISEDNDASDPDDNASGGTLIFTFDNAVMLDEIRLLDIDQGESLFVRLYDAAGAEISSTSSAGSSGGNGFHVVDLSATGVARMEVELTGSGAITDVIFCREDHANSINSATINGPATIPEGSDYDLSLNTGIQNLSGWVVNWGDGTVENVAAGTTSVSHRFADGASVVRPIAFATATDGSVYRTNRLTVQVQNVAPQLAINGDAAVQAESLYTLNLASDDPGADTITQWVVDWGDGTDPQEILGNPDTVTHLFAESGDYSIVATAVDEDSSENQTPSTLQIRARGSEGAEQFDLQIDGVTVSSYQVTTQDQTFTYAADQPLLAGQIRILFTNDVYDPGNGIDNNLIVDYITIDGQTFQTESPDVYSTGTWKSEDGIEPGYRQSEWLHANGYFQYSGDATLGPVQPYVSNTLVVNVMAADPVEPEDDGWLPAIDFESDYNQIILHSGDVITDQFAALGVHVTTSDPINHPAMIFDSSAPTGGDSDLGTPNQNFGGPGIGSGGQNGVAANDVALGNILIISEDADASDPDDNYNGGTLIFTFDSPVMLDEIGLLDVDNREATLRLLDANGQVILTRVVDGAGNNSHQTIALDATDVSRLEVILTGSGAVTDLVFCRDGENSNHEGVVEPVTPKTKFYTVDGANDSGFQYDASGANLGSFDLVDGAIARGVTTTVTGNPVWVVKSNEWVYVYDRTDDSFLGKWDAVGPTVAQGIATNGTDFWIVDDQRDRVYVYENASDWRSGSHSATRTFNLNNYNDDPTGIEVNGDTVWVTDSRRDQVFVYSTQGQYQGKWNLDSQNGRSSGIATDAGGNHLWVTDYDDGEIYYYEDATSRRGGQQSATATIELAANNQRPEGIADPAIPISLDEVVNGAISAAGEQAEYTFNVTAGERVYFNKLSGSGGFGWSLTSPSGQTVFSNLSFSDVATTELAQDGTYVLTVGRTNGNTTGNFSFQLADVLDTTVETIALDELVQFSFSTAGEEKAFEFSVADGERVYFDRGAGASFIGWRLVAPSGQEVFNGQFSDVTTTTLNEAGIYRLSVGGANQDFVGNASFQLFDVPETTVEPIDLEQVVSSSITVAGQEKSYTFSGLENQEIFFDQIFGSGSVLWRLEDSSGATLFDQRFETIQSFVLPADDVYQLTIGRSTQIILSTFSFSLIEVTAPVVESIEFDTLVQGKISNIADRNEYTFTAASGTSIFFDWESISGDIEFDLISPIGSIVSSGTGRNGDNLDGDPIALTETGLYTLSVGKISRTEDSFKLKLIEVPATTETPISFDQLVSGAIDVQGQKARYVFDANAGESLTIDVAFVADDLGYTLFAPNGSAVILRSGGSRSVASLPQTGTYVVEFDNRIQNNDDRRGAFNFRIVNDIAASVLPETADLNVTVTDVTPTLVAASPAAITATWAVTNQDAAATTVTQWVDRIFLTSTAQSPGFEDLEIGEVVHQGALGVGQSYTQSLTFELPAGFEADFQVYVITDVLNQVFEGANENNNGTASTDIVSVYENERDGQGQTQLDIDIPNDTTFPSGLPVSLTGTAAATAGTSNMVFVIDVSSSTRDLPAGGLDANFDGVIDSNDDINADGRVGDILDAELGAVITAVRLAQETAIDLRVSVILFGAESEALDLGANLLNQTYIEATADQNSDGVSDFEQAVRSVAVGGADLFRPIFVNATTDFTPAIHELSQVLSIEQDVDRTTVYFLSDAAAGAVATDVAQPIADAGVDFRFLQISGTEIGPSGQQLVDDINNGVSTASARLIEDPEDLVETIVSDQIITDVKVNGVSVDLLDDNGRFSTPVILTPGENQFLVESFTASGRVATEILTLIGESANVFDINNTQPVQGLEEGWTATTFNRRTNQLHTDLTVTNNDQYDYTATIGGVFDSIGSPAVTVAAATVEGFDEFGDAYVLLDDEITGGVLSVGETSDVVPVSFHNTLRQRFDVDVDFHVTPNAAPVIVSTPETVASPDSLYESPLRAFDANGDVLTFTILSGPDGLTLDTTQPNVAVLQWTPTTDDIGNHQVTILVEDGRGGTAEHNFSLLVPSALPNQAPLITSTPDRLATLDELFSYDIDASDPEGELVTLALDAAAPAGVALTGNQLTWTPSIGDMGEAVIEIVASDPQGATSTQRFTLNIRGINEAPVFVSTPESTVFAGKQYRYSALATDSEDEVRYSLEANVDGVSIDAISGFVSFAAADLGVASTSFTIIATDARGLTAEQDVTVDILEINALNDQLAPVVALVSEAFNPLAALRLDETNTVFVSATDNVDVVSLTLSVNGTEVVLDTSGRFQFNAIEAGIYTFTATAIDAAGNSIQRHAAIAGDRSDGHDRP